MDTNEGPSEGQESVNYNKVLLETFRVGRSIKNEIDAEISEFIELESNEYYNNVVNTIVTNASAHLQKSEEEKKTLRGRFFIFFLILLSVQLLSVIVFTLFNATGWFGFEMTDYMLSVFIGSVFVETLASIGIMIAFAYASNDEVKIIELLTAVVESYQKYYRKNGNKDGKDNKNN